VSTEAQTKKLSLFSSFLSSQMEFFTGAIEKYTAHLLSSISTDYGLNLDELKARYIGVKIVKAKAPKVPMADRPMCSGTVGKKKEPCKNKARAGETTCHIHGEKPPVDVCQPCKVPQVPAPAPAPVQATEPSLADSVRNLANIAAEVSQEIKVKKPKKKKVLEAPPPPPPPADLVEEAEEPEEVPEPEVIDDLSARLQAMLADGAAFDEDDDEDDEEPESPGTQRHKEILGAKGVAWEEYYGEDDEEDEELLEEEDED
jgi:hypothetical protein